MVHIKKKKKKKKKERETGQIGMVFQTLQIPLLLSWKRGIFISDLSWVSRDIAEVEMLPNQEHHIVSGAV